MKSNYVLKKSPVDPQKINRLLKNVETNSKKDRDKAEELLEECQARLADADTVESFQKVISSYISVLNQMSKSNELLLKLANTLHKFLTESKDDSTGFSGSVFEELNKLIKDTDTDA